MAVYSGFTSSTADHLVIDSGAFYKNYDLATGVGTLLGATRGGGEFSAKPTVRAIEVDGVKGRAKGLNAIDAWEVYIKATLLEITPESLAAALSTGSVDSDSNEQYHVITAGNTLQLTDYIDNITWVGRLSGSNNPVVIQIFNALSTDGVTLTTADKSESLLPVNFAAHYDAADLDKVPFAVYYPKLTVDTTPPTVTVAPTDGATAIPVAANVVWTFSEAINPSAVNPANFLLFEAEDGTLIPGSLSLNVAKTVVTLNPTANLAAGTAYVAMVTANVKDLKGNALAANTATSFITA